jgi:hypothetical protein
MTQSFRQWRRPNDLQPAISHIAKERPMSSKTFQKKMIKKRKQHAHKANNKAEQKRIARNHEILFPKAG